MSMPPVADIRVGLLNSFVAEVGGQNAAASLLGYKAPAYVRQMLGLVPAKPRAITEKSILAWLKHTDQRVVRMATAMLLVPLGLQGDAVAGSPPPITSQPTDEQVLDWMGTLLTRMPAGVEDDFASALASWARQRGRGKGLQVLLLLLSGRYRKPSGRSLMSAQVLTMPPRRQATTPRSERPPAVVRVEGISGDWGLFDPVT